MGALVELLGRLPEGALRAATRALFSASWRRFQEAVREPERVQRERLQGLLLLGRDTAFGQEHDYASLSSLEDFKARVPVRGFDAFAPYIDRMVAGEGDVLVPGQPYFYGRSSGTTGRPKHIPVTPAYVAEYRRPRRVWARQVMMAFPGLLRGKMLTMHSPGLEGQTDTGVPYGSVTVGLTTKPGRPQGALKRGTFDAVPRSIYLIEDFDLKYATLLRLAVQEKISLAAAINPSTLVLLSERLAQLAPQLSDDLRTGDFFGLDALPDDIRKDVQACLRKSPAVAERLKQDNLRPVDVWPDIVGLLCWKGGSAPFYLDQLKRWFPNRPAMDYGFLATEGGFSLPMDPAGSDGVVSVLGHVLEFVPEGDMNGPHPQSFLAHELEVGQRYRVLVTGAHGLARYDINDVVECTGYYEQTARIVFVHKGGNMLSITGEKVSEAHVVEAARRAEQHTSVRAVGFSVSCRLHQPPHYVVAAEFEDRDGGPAWLDAFERGLRDVNLEYEAKRASQRLGQPELRILEPGAFERARARRVAEGAPDAHVKPPHLLRDMKRLEALLETS